MKHAKNSVENMHVDIRALKVNNKVVILGCSPYVCYAGCVCPGGQTGAIGIVIMMELYI